ncbi:MAG: DNA-3-methyladenine glycosylase 2 family protein [Caldilineaceae bacterium]|nr:DNA-3-methyladenine glycosylase 2 family protein [Caldilineaceae bacterium]
MPKSLSEPISHASLPPIVEELARRDPDLARIATRYGIPPLWDREPGFPTLVLLILEQQVSLASARAVFERLCAATGSLVPERLLLLDEDGLRAIGFSRQKAGYVRGMAHAIMEGRFDPHTLSEMEDKAARAELIKLKGIGPWTADVYLLMALGRADVWPAGDLALQIAIQEVKGLAARPASSEMETLAEAWRPWRSVAARLLWQHYLGRKA